MVAGLLQSMKDIFVLSLLLTLCISKEIPLSEYEQQQRKNIKVLLSGDLQIQDKIHYPQIKKLVFTTPWNKKGREYVLKYGNKITYVSPCWYELQLDKHSHPKFQNQHNFDSQFYTDLRNTHPHVKVLPRVYVSANGAEFIQKIGTDRKSFIKAIKLIANLFKQKGFDGLVWDSPYNFFEMGRLSLNLLIADFLKNLRQQLGEDKLIFFNMANPIDHMKNLDMDTYIQLEIDAFLIQNYDKGGRYLDIIDKSIEWFKILNKKADLILMLPFFSVQENNARSLSTEEAAQTLKQKGISSARISNGICLFGQANSKVRYYIPCYSYFKNAFQRARKAGANVGFWEGGNGLQTYYRFF